ncbi:MAG: hypothetical protein K0S28_1062 [Paucimonas sp.]|jgi:ElaB/YqjD/DUF883 family membrane-anchored ribosome-binding protein|nr:hypothetical protein [Paucimonas sp.]
MSSTFPPGQSASDFEPSVSGITGETAIGSESGYYANDATQGSGSLRGNLTSLKSELDELLNRADSLSENELNQAYVQLMTKFSSVRFAAKSVADQASRQFRTVADQASRQFRTVADQASRQFNDGVEVTTTYVKDRPLQSVAIATGVGLALGILFGRR